MSEIAGLRVCKMRQDCVFKHDYLINWIYCLLLSSQDQFIWLLMNENEKVSKEVSKFVQFEFDLNGLRVGNTWLLW